MKILSFVSLASMLCLGACVVNGDDGDDTSNTTTSSTNPTTAADDGNDDAPGTTAPGDGSTSSTPSDSSAGDDTAGSGGATDTGTAGETGAAGSCGWGATGQVKITDGYICGGDGESPTPEMFPIDCPAEVELVAGGVCGTIRGQGCCDANGDVWFCASDNGAEPVLFTDDCSM
jgi:hypothetical protein